MGKIFPSAEADGLFGTVPVVSEAAAVDAAAAASTLFLSFWRIDGFSDTSKLRIWFGLRALDAIEAIGQPGKLIIGAASGSLDVCLERG